MKWELDALTPMYQKFLRANLTTGEYEIGRVADDEATELAKAKPKTIQEYFEWFGSSGLIAADDKEIFLKSTAEADAGASIIYQRLIAGAWKTVIMQIVPTNDYRTDNKDCIIYVRDISDVYQREYEKVIDKIGTTDTLTGLYNRLAFERDKDKEADGYVGILFADVNGLKWTNDNLGHAAGDELIVKFANLLSLRFDNKCRCYHLSGDEFVVMSRNNIKDFLAASVGLHKGLWNTPEYPIASLGYSVGTTDEINDVLEEAEKEMRDDKRMFYTKFPKYIRK